MSGAPNVTRTSPRRGQRHVWCSTRSTPSSRTGTTGRRSFDPSMPTPGWNVLISPRSVRWPSGKIRIEKPSVDELAHVAQRPPGSRLLLWQRERIEEERDEIVDGARRQSFPGRVVFGKEMRIEVFLRHRDGDRSTPPTRKRLQNDGRIEMALMVGREDDRPGQARPSARVLRPEDGRRRWPAAESTSVG